MGLLSTMTTSLTGLQAAETTIDVVGNNVANSNTVGFKESNVLFATQFSQTQSVGSGPTDNSGGTNPRQIGLGVKVSEIAPDFTQGTIEISSNPLDLAIQGDGFFIVAGSGQGQEFFTRNGQFKTNSDNEIVTTTGHRVVGYTVNDSFELQTNQRVPLTIPLGGSQVAQETDNVTLVGNLLPNGTVASLSEIIESAVLSDNSKEVPTDLATGAVTELQGPAVGTTVSAAGVSGPVGTQVPAGSYRYKITYLDPLAYTSTNQNNESPASAEIGPVTAVADDVITLNNIPAPTDTDFTQMRIYRSLGTGDFELVEQVAYNATYVDDSPTTGADLNEDSVGLVPYSYFVTFANSTIESRPTAQSATVSISSAGRRIRLENIPQPASGSEFTSIRIYRNVNNQPGTFYLVDELTPTPGIMNYIDNKPDVDIISTDDDDILDRSGPPISTSLPLVNVSTFNGTDYVNLFDISALPTGETATLRFAGARGTPPIDLATKELEIDDETTVQELITFMEQAFGVEQSFPDADPDEFIGTPGGRIEDSRLVFESNVGEQNALSVSQSSFSLLVNGVPQGVPVDFTTTQEGNGEGSTNEMVVFDSLGTPITVRLTTALVGAETGTTTFRWFATSPDHLSTSGVDTTVGTGLITFDGHGAFTGATNRTVTIDRLGVASVSPVTIDVDFSQVTSLVEINGDSSAQMTSQDGFASGSLASFSITDSGLIKGVYTNGVTRDLGQLVMARFANNGGLQSIGDNLWARGVNSGEPLPGTPGENGIGTITAGAVELSNSDIGQNLVELILASTQYRGGSRVITTAQQLLDELLNIRR